MTVDLDSDGNLSTEAIRATISNSLRAHRLGEYTAHPDQFYFREFGGKEEGRRVLNIMLVYEMEIHLFFLMAKNKQQGIYNINVFKTLLLYKYPCFPNIYLFGKFTVKQ